MTSPIYFRLCDSCKHLDPVGSGSTPHSTTCKAFPKMIPDAIAKGAPHFDSVEGDGGVVFEMKV